MLAAGDGPDPPPQEECPHCVPGSGKPVGHKGRHKTVAVRAPRAAGRGSHPAARAMPTKIASLFCTGPGRPASLSAHRQPQTRSAISSFEALQPLCPKETKRVRPPPGEARGGTVWRQLQQERPPDIPVLPRRSATGPPQQKKQEPNAGSQAGAPALHARGAQCVGCGADFDDSIDNANECEKTE